MGHVMFSVINRPGEPLGNAGFQLCAQCFHPGIIVLQLFLTDAAGFTKGGNIRGSFGARTHAAFLSAAYHQRSNTDTFTDI